MSEKDPSLTTETSQPDPQPAKKTRRSNGKTAIGLLLILIVGIGAFSVYQYQQQQRSDAELASVKSALETFQQQQSPFAENQENLKNALAQLGEQQLKLDGRQQALEQKWHETQQQRPNEWLLAEASYLLRMSGRKLWLEQDLTTSIALLTDADGRLQAMADPSLIPLRKALAEDIASLKSAPNVDIEGLTLRVGILIDNLDQLKIKGSDPKRSVPETDEISEQISDWKDNLAKSAKNFAENFITIHRRTGDVEALLSPDQSAYLLENLRLQLQLSQLNLQHQDQANFRDHLKKAQTWLQTYYEADDSTTQFMLKEIDALQQMEITAHYPVEFKSQPILEKVIVERSQTSAR